MVPSQNRSIIRMDTCFYGFSVDISMDAKYLKVVEIIVLSEEEFSAFLQTFAETDCGLKKESFSRSMSQGHC